MARVGLVLVGAVIVFCALWLTRQPTPTEIDAARMKRLAELLLRLTPHNYPATAGGIPDLGYVMKRMEIEGRDDFDLLISARTGDEEPRSINDIPYELWSGAASFNDGRPYIWDKWDDPEGYRLVARLAAVEGGGWTVEVERMRANELETLCERYEVQR